MLAALTSASSARAQSIIPPPPSVSTIPPAMQQPGTADEATRLDSVLLGALPKGLPFSYGPVTFRPHLTYQFLYGDGISSGPGNQHKTAVNQFSPGILLNIGEKWVLDYTPTLRYYSNKAFTDGVDHSVRFSGGTQYEDWTFGVSQGYSISSAPQVETLSQTETESFTTGLNAGYAFNSKLSLDLSVSQNFNSTGNAQSQVPTANLQQSSRTWSTMEYLNYQIHPKLTVGIGPGFTYSDVESGSDMTSEQIQARISYRPAQKASFNVHGGVDIRQFLSGGAEDMVSPIFGASVAYAIFEQTRLSLTVDHSVSPSLYTSQVNESTSVSAGLSQRLLKHLNLSLSGGYSKSSYVASTPGLAQTRSDDRYNFSARLGTQILKRASLGLSYTYSQTKSDVALYSYDSNMIGVDVGYRW
jgi:hypothetical protein